MLDHLIHSASAESVGHLVQPLPWVLADMSIIPVYHHAKHIALDNIWEGDDLKLVDMCSEAPAGGTFVALAIVS